MRVRSFLLGVIKICLSILFWVAGLFFVIGGLTQISRSVSAAVLMVSLGVILIPPFWHLVRKIQPKLFSVKLRTIVSIVLLVAAIVVMPTEPVQTTSDKKASAPVVVSRAEKPIEIKKATPNKKDQSPVIRQISYTNGAYKVTGRGIADAEYQLKFSSSPSVTVKADNVGSFSTVLPATTQVFGYVELVHDANGAWFGGEQTHHKIHFVLDGYSTKQSDDPIEPTILGMGGAGKYNISGYYTPKSVVVLKSGDRTLSTAQVDKTGRYHLRDIQLDVNYTETALYERTSTGWLSSKHVKLTDVKYLDKKQTAILRALPTFSKQRVVEDRVAFSSRTVESGSLPKGETSISQAGSDGVRTRTYEVLYRGDIEVSQKLINDEVTRQPIEKIVVMGMYVAPVYVAPSSQPPAYVAPSQSSSGGRSGAVCRDGSSSSATGRGACSHHGGVAHWVY